jgi:hypothetical protein
MFRRGQKCGRKPCLRTPSAAKGRPPPPPAAGSTCLVPALPPAPRGALAQQRPPLQWAAPQGIGQPCQWWRSMAAGAGCMSIRRCPATCTPRSWHRRPGRPGVPLVGLSSRAEPLTLKVHKTIAAQRRLSYRMVHMLYVL